MKPSPGKRHHYAIAVRQFKQQILPLDFPATTVWGYGPAGDPLPNSTAPGGQLGVAPAPNSQFNYPGYTIEAVKGREITVDWINDLVSGPWGEGHGQGDYLPHLVPVDQTLHWANPGRLRCTDATKSQDCRPDPRVGPELQRPYEGPVPIVTHVHGSHADPESDGYPEAWYLPAAKNIPKGYAETGTLVNRFGRTTNRSPGVASFRYRNDPTSKTLWYHDHTLGITRNNVYAGLAGFWLIRDPKARSGETGLIAGKLPGPAPQAGEDFRETNQEPGRNKYREIPVVIQDRSFNRDGSLFYPSSRSLENVPFIGNPQNKSDIPPIWNPEFFGNVMVVNGASWPSLSVAPELYRFRLLNGCNSRFLNLALRVVTAGESYGSEVPFYQIAAEQGLLPKVVNVTTGFKTRLPGRGANPSPTRTSAEQEALLMAPAERADVLVDFSGLKAGTKVRMVNTGPDGTFTGFSGPFVPADPLTTGQVMEFHVRGAAAPGGEAATPPEDLMLSLPSPHDPANRAGPGHRTRDLALLEEMSKQVCVTQENGRNVYDPAARVYKGMCVGGNASSMPFGPTATLLGVAGSKGGVPTMWAGPIATSPRLFATETWELWNWTPDVHPIHLHLVRFKVVSRQDISADTGVVQGPLLAPAATEDGWKDTVAAYPGQVTRVKAFFDIAGLYVWHCHMLEHEDNEMMATYCVGNTHLAPGCRFAAR